MLSQEVDVKLKVSFTAQLFPCVVSFYVKMHSQIIDNKLVVVVYVSSNTRYIRVMDFGFHIVS